MCLPELEKSALKGKKVFLLEENDKVRRSLETVLIERGITVVTKSSTECAKKYLEEVEVKKEFDAFMLGEENLLSLDSIDVRKCIAMAWPGSEAAKSSTYYAVLQRPIKHMRLFDLLTALVKGNSCQVCSCVFAW